MGTWQKVLDTLCGLIQYWWVITCWPALYVGECVAEEATKIQGETTTQWVSSSPSSDMISSHHLLCKRKKDFISLTGVWSWGGQWLLWPVPSGEMFDIPSPSPSKGTLEEMVTSELEPNQWWGWGWCTWMSGNGQLACRSTPSNSFSPPLYSSFPFPHFSVSLPSICLQ